MGRLKCSLFILAKMNRVKHREQPSSTLDSRRYTTQTGILCWISFQLLNKHNAKIKFIQDVITRNIRHATLSNKINTHSRRICTRISTDKNMMPVKIYGVKGSFSNTNKWRCSEQHKWRCSEQLELETCYSF